MEKKNDKNITFHNFKINVHEIKLNLHSKITNFNYKVQNCKLHQNEIFDVLSLFWNRTIT